jgi:hypothetical protein
LYLVFVVNKLTRPYDSSRNSFNISEWELTTLVSGNMLLGPGIVFMLAMMATQFIHLLCWHEEAGSWPD